MLPEKILYIGGREGRAEKLALALAAKLPGLELAQVTGQEAAAALPGRCDLIIAEHGAGCDAFALLDKRGLLAPDTPCLILTGPGTEGGEAELIRKGADCCLPLENTAGLPAMACAVLERSLTQARRRRARELEVVGRVSRVIAHDFNNITGAIEGYASLNLMQLPPDAPIRPDLEGIRKAVSKASALTKQLLVFSRRQLLKKTMVDLPVFMEGLVLKMRQAAGESFKLELRLQAGLPWISAAEPQLEQLFMNLLSNSLDAMPGGGGIVIGAGTVSLEPGEVRARNPEADGTEFVKFTFSDQGAGMPGTVQERLFEPFFTTKPKGKGTGMGLASVYGIVLQHLGWIEVRSAEGKGAEFSVFLPAGPEKPKPAPTPGARGI